MNDWSVRDDLRKTQTGFGSNETIAVDTYNQLVEYARDSGKGGSYSLIRNGEVVSSATIPAGKGDAG